MPPSRANLLLFLLVITPLALLGTYLIRDTARNTDSAMQAVLAELLKLAKLNQRGVQAEWEFNEWAHARTGNPMGKAYQAWSAAEFILACHEVGLEEHSA